MYAIGVDTGGTFTDILMIDEAGAITIGKVPSTPDHPERAVIDGLDELGIDPGAVARFVHGTTVNTNTMLTGTGAKTALLTTEGFRDVLEIRRAHRLADYANIYNLQQELPKPLVPRRHRKEVGERVLFDGKVLHPLDEDGVRAVAEGFKADGMEAVAVVFLFSYNHPAHEARARVIIEEALPDAFVTTSVATDPVFREYERTSTTVINAYLGPRSRAYFPMLERLLKERGITAEILLMGSNGGTITVPAATARPVTTVISGLAGGATGGAFLAAETGRKNLITVDIGGTSCDVCLIHDGVATVTTEGEIAGHALTIPIIDVHTIGAGGGSIAWIDSGGALRVGPQSAGAAPGPACYGQGGDLPTVTDANLVLGYLNPENFLGGKMALDVDKARAAIADHVVAPHGFASVEDAAFAVHQIVNANMASAMRVVSVEKGHDPRAFTLAIFGGGGPVHGAALADALDIPEVLVPRYPGIHSAAGLIAADNRHDFRRSYLAPVAQADLTYIQEIFDGLAAEGRAQLDREGIAVADQEVQRLAELRYMGQAHEVTLAVPDGPITNAVVAATRARFDEMHKALYNHASPEAPAMFVTLAVRAVGRTPNPTFKRLAAGTDAPVPVATRRVCFGPDDKFPDTPIYDRERLLAGQRIAGPAIVEQMDSTTLIPPGTTAEVDEIGSLILRKTGEHHG